MRWECRERIPRHRLHGKPLISNPGMHPGTCVTHVGIAIPRWRGNIPGIPGTCATRSFTYLARGPWKKIPRLPCIVSTMIADAPKHLMGSNSHFTDLILPRVWLQHQQNIEKITYVFWPLYCLHKLLQKNILLQRQHNYGVWNDWYQKTPLLLMW